MSVVTVVAVVAVVVLVVVVVAVVVVVVGVGVVGVVAVVAAAAAVEAEGAAVPQKAEAGAARQQQPWQWYLTNHASGMSGVFRRGVYVSDALPTTVCACF